MGKEHSMRDFHWQCCDPWACLETQSVNLKKLVMTGIDYSTFVDIPGLVEKAKEKLVHFELSAKYI